MKIPDETWDATSVRRYLGELQKYPPLSREEERKTLARARLGDGRATDRLITSNLRFVVSVALEYRGRGLPLSELIAEGNVGLLEALKRFDEKRGYKLISYAVWWIHQAIQKALKQTSTVSVPVNRQEDLGKIARRSREMAQELGQVPTTDQVSGDLKISRERAERALRSALSDLSLESPLDGSGDEARTLLHILKAEGPPPDRYVLDRDLRELVETCLASCLDDREQRIIRAYFGLDGESQLTLQKIGLQLGITRERVRQIRNHALDKLRRFLQRQAADTVQTGHDLY